MAFVSSLALSKSVSLASTCPTGGCKTETRQPTRVSFACSTPGAGLPSSVLSLKSGVFASTTQFLSLNTRVRSTSSRFVVRAAVLQFIRGVDEQTIPDVRLTRAKDGSSGTATFLFDQPSVFDSSRELGDITGLYMIDEEGVLQTVDVSAKFVNGKPSKVEALYVMRSEREWERFLRFMERYAEKNSLGFTKS